MSESKESFCSLYSFIRKHNSKLYDLLDDICATGLFRPRDRNEVTFLNPDDKLTKELEKMINKGDGEEALNKLKSLFIYGKHDKLSGDLVTYNRKKIKTDLSKLSKSKNFKQWSSKNNSYVFEYTLATFPEESATVEAPKTKKKTVKGSSENKNRIHATEEITKDVHDKKHNHKVAYKLNSLLEFIKKKDNTLYNKVVALVDPNMTLTWYILVQPTKMDNHHISNELFEEWYAKGFKNPINSVSLIKQIFTTEMHENSKLKEISQSRKQIKDVGFEDTQRNIIEAYNNNYEKLLEDELRFRYSDETTLNPEDIHAFNIINWDEPKKSLILFGDVPKSSLLRTEIHSMMVSFVQSNAFLYTPFNKSIREKITNHIQGAGAGNENVKKMIEFLGTDNINDIKHMETESLTLAEFIESLTDSQKKDLSQLLVDYE